jgi:hypothetical protein
VELENSLSDEIEDNDELIDTPDNEKLDELDFL